jgi:prevent-host-death family protein
MKEVTLERFADEVGETLEAAQQDRILVTRNGQPLAVIIGIADRDEEHLQLATSTEFWRMIEERRRRPTVPFDEVKAKLFGDKK